MRKNGAGKNVEQEEHPRTSAARGDVGLRCSESQERALSLIS